MGSLNGDTDCVCWDKQVVTVARKKRAEGDSEEQGVPKLFHCSTSQQCALFVWKVVLNLVWIQVFVFFMDMALLVWDVIVVLTA